MTDSVRQALIQDLARASAEFERWHESTVSALQERARRLREQAGRLAALREAADQLAQVSEQLNAARAEADARRTEAEALRSELDAMQSELAVMEEMRGRLAEKEGEAAELEALRGALSEKDAQLAELESLRAALAEQHAQLGELEALRDALVAQNAQLDEMDALRAALAERDARITELTPAAGRASELEAELASARSRLEAEEEARISVNLEKKMLLDQIEGLRLAAAEAEELRGRVEKLENELEDERAKALRQQAPAAVRVDARPPAPAPAPAAQEPVSMLQKVLKSRSRGPRRQLGEILTSSGLLTQEQLDEAIRVQVSDPRRRLGAIIVDLGFATEDVVAATLAAQLRTRFVDNLEREMTPEAMRVVPQNLAIHHRCVPLVFGGGTLSVAMANPLDLIAIEDLQHATGTYVEPVVATATAIDRVLNKYYMKTKSSGFTTR